ncbi:hypothetical protein ACFL3N_02475, partial [Candidatus Omnitrophota bacterium]
MSTNTDLKTLKPKPADPQETGLEFLRFDWRKYLLLFGTLMAFGKFMSLHSRGGEVWNQVVRRNVAFAALSGILVLSIFNVILPYLMLVLYLPFTTVIPGRFGMHVRAFNMFNALFFIVMTGMIVEWIKKKRPFFVINPVTKYVTILFVLSVVNYVFSSFYYGGDYARYHLFVLKRWLDPMLLFFVTSVLTISRNERKDCLIAIMVGTAMIAFLAIKDYGHVTHFTEQRRISGAADQPNILGAFCVDYMFIFMGIFLVNLRKKVYWLA